MSIETLPSPSPGGWIGPRLAAREIGAILFIGVVGIMFAGVGPLLLGGLQQAGRITAAQLGQAGTAELLTMGVAAGLAGSVAGLARLRPLAIGSALTIVVLNLATIWAQGWLLVAIRGINGVPSGALIWLVTAMIVRTPRPERWSAIYVTVQTLAQLLVVAALGAMMRTPADVDFGFLVMAVLGALAAGSAMLIPARFAALPVAADEPSGLPSMRGLLALAAPFCFNAAILAAWIYMDPLSRQAGHPPHTADLAISLSLAAQVAGGLLATLLAGRIAWMPTLAVSLTAMTALLLCFVTLPTAVVFLALSATFGFLWMFASPFMTPLLIDADPTRRAAVFGSGAGLLGCSVGPFLASLVVSDADVRGCVLLGTALMLAAIAVVVLLRLTHSRAPVTAAR